MDPLFIRVPEPLTPVDLQLRERGINLHTKREAIELVEPGLMPSLHDAIGLRTLPFGTGMLDVFNR
jgi:hypothetical protein